MLVGCPQCGRQYETDRREPGSRFGCACGAELEVPSAHPVDSAVVRCSACGAARSRGEAACRFCGAEFSLLDRDRNTLCPACAGRIPDRARFCPCCGATIVALPAAAAAPHACPACGPERRLVARRLDRGTGAALECPACTGLWLDRSTFEHLAAAARRERAPLLAARPTPSVPTGAAAPYRRCPECNKLMHRRNKGGRSGVLVDVCQAHGLWFDAEELERVLAWLRAGGAEAAEAARTAEARERLRADRLQRELSDASARQRGESAPYDITDDPLLRALDWVIRGLAGIFRAAARGRGSG